MAATDLLIAQIVVKAEIDSEGASTTTTHNVYQFFRNQTVNVWTEAHIISAFWTALGTAYKAIVSVDAGSFVVSMRNLNDATHAYTDVTETGTGAVTGERMPDYVTQAVYLLSGLRGAQFRGKKFISPLGESQCEGDVMSAGSITDFGTYGAAIVAGFTDSDSNVWKPCVVQFSQSTLDVNPTFVPYAPITSYKLAPQLSHLNRRKA